MKKILKVSIGPLILITSLWGCFGKSTEHHNSKLSDFLDCPDSPNCVSSLAKNPKHRVEPFHLKNDPKTSWDIIEKRLPQCPEQK